MYLSPFAIKTYKINSSKIAFLKELRQNTREPYYDGKNSRRKINEDNRLFINEFGNYIFLKSEIIGFRWITNKTIIRLKETNSELKVLTFSYPGGLGGFFYIIFGLVASLLFGIKTVIEEGDFTYLLAFVLIYALAVAMIKSDFEEQNDLVKKIAKFSHNN